MRTRALSRAFSLSMTHNSAGIVRAAPVSYGIAVRCTGSVTSTSMPLGCLTGRWRANAEERHSRSRCPLLPSMRRHRCSATSWRDSGRAVAPPHFSGDNLSNARRFNRLGLSNNRRHSAELFATSAWPKRRLSAGLLPRGRVAGSTPCPGRNGRGRTRAGTARLTLFLTWPALRSGRTLREPGDQ